MIILCCAGFGVNEIYNDCMMSFKNKNYGFLVTYYLCLVDSVSRQQRQISPYAEVGMCTNYECVRLEWDLSTINDIR